MDRRLKSWKHLSHMKVQMVKQSKFEYKFRLKFMKYELMLLFGVEGGLRNLLGGSWVYVNVNTEKKKSYEID